MPGNNKCPNRLHGRFWNEALPPSSPHVEKALQLLLVGNLTMNGQKKTIRRQMCVSSSLLRRVCKCNRNLSSERRSGSKRMEDLVPGGQISWTIHSLSVAEEKPFVFLHLTPMWNADTAAMWHTFVLQRGSKPGTAGWLSTGSQTSASFPEQV